MKAYIAAVIGLLIHIGFAQAAVRTWNNGAGDTRWINGGASGNWSGDPVPGAADDAVFSAVGGTADLNNGGSGNSVDTITFNPGLPQLYLMNSWNIMPTFNDVLSVGTSISQNGATSVSIYSTVINCPTLNVNGGNLEFIGTNLITISGSVNVNGGTVCVESYPPSSISATFWNVASGAILKGSGLPTLTVPGSYPTIIGTVNLFPGATFMPGCSVGTINIHGNLVCFAAGMAFGFELSQPGVVGGGNDLINVEGDMTLNGTINVAALPGFNIGTYRLCNYSGALVNSGVLLGAFPAGYHGQLDFSTTNQVNLIVTAADCCDDCEPPYPDSYMVTVNPGANYLVNHLCRGTNNTFNDLLLSVPVGSQVLKWNGSGLDVWNRVVMGTGWAPASGATEKLDPGEGFIVNNNSGTNFTLTIDGCEPTNCPLPCLPPTSGLVLVGRLGIGTATWTNLSHSNCPPVCGTRISIWNGSSFDDYDYVNGAWTPQEPVLAVGESAFVSVQANTNCCEFQVLCATNKVVECGTVWAFDPPVVLTNCCTNFTLTILSTQTNSFDPCATTVTRIWEATDCGTDSVTCTQMVSVVDTTPPAILCASNKMVECGTFWSFDPPTVVDACCGTNITVQLLSTNSTFISQCLTEWEGVWQATDCCSNSITCTQLVSVVDNTPPVLICASNKTVECGPNWAFDPPTAHDLCCTNVTVQLLSSNWIAGPCPDVWEGVWQAIDCCSNSITCTQLVSVVDTTPPVVYCPKNIIRYTCTNSLRVYYKARATDNCSPIVSLTYNPPSGTTFFAGTTTPVTVTATDACGNTNTCMFTVKVVDRTYWHFVVCGRLDCFRRPNEPVIRSGCLSAAYPAVNWKPFDEDRINRHFGHSFLNLPGGIVDGWFFTRLRPNCWFFSQGARDDTIKLGLGACNPAGWIWDRYIGSGNPSAGLLPVNWCGQRGCGVGFWFDLESLPGGGNVLPHMNSAHRLDMLVEDDTRVDVAYLWLRRCPPTYVLGGLGASTSNAIFAYAWNGWCLALAPASLGAYGGRFNLGNSSGVRAVVDVSSFAGGTVAFENHLIQESGALQVFGVTQSETTNSPGGVALSAALPACVQQLTVELLLNGVPVSETNGLPGMAAEILTSTIPLSIAEVGFTGGTQAVLWLSSPQQVSGVFGTVEADEIRVSTDCAVPAGDPIVGTEFHITAEDVPEVGVQSVTPVATGFARHAVEFFGEALMEVGDGQFVLSPLDEDSDSPGGYTVGLSQATNEFRAVLGLPPEASADVTGGPPPFGYTTNSRLTLIARGVVGGVDRDLPALHFDNNNTNWNLRASRDDLPLTLSRVQVVLDGVVQADIANPTNVHVAQLPPVHWPTTIWFADDDICHRFPWPTSVDVQVNGVPYLATELRVQTDTYGQPVEALTGERVEAIRLAGLVLSGIETGPPEYVFDPPQLNTEGLTIGWSGIGGVLEGSATITGPWAPVSGAAGGEITLPTTNMPAGFFRVRDP